MRKWVLLSVAGVGAFLFGCRSEPVMDQQKFLPAPGDDEVVQATPASVAVPPAVKPAVAAVKYEPMVGAVASGGVDSVPAGKRGGSAQAVAGSGIYVVQSGDNPGKIARKLKVSVKALMAVNGLDEASAKKLRPGQKLKVPTGASAVAAVAPKKSGAKAVKTSGPSAVPTLKDGKYTVVSGDTPDKIAKRFHVKVSALMAANNLNESSARGLQIGQKLIIPGVSTIGESAPAPAPAVKPAVESVNSDAVSKSAEQKVSEEGTTVAPVETPAPVAESSETSSVTLDADATWEELAAKYGCTVEELKKNNPDEAGSDKILAGAFILLPPKSNK